MTKPKKKKSLVGYVEKITMEKVNHYGTVSKNKEWIKVPAISCYKTENYNTKVRITIEEVS